jgi:hypothetical protein
MIHGFSKANADRVIDATKRVEQMPPERRGGGNPDTRLNDPTDWAPVQIEASPTRDGAKWRWAYSGTPMRRTAAGHAGRTADGRYGSTIQLYNTFEDANEASGIVSGYDLAEPEIVGIEPIEAGLVVFAWYERYDNSGAAGQWCFCVRNNPIIECPEV